MRKEDFQLPSTVFLCKCCAMAHLQREIHLSLARYHWSLAQTVRKPRFA